SVEHQGAFSISPDKYDLLDQKNIGDNHFKSIVQIKGSLTPNQLIRDLTDVTEVQSFIEKIPTMSEIFITLVKGGSDE
ncbi:MAG TPA: DUF4162 domain-containing protein, partial [Chryseolinea sp.]|nr:DUF4162 domain-containing protein [Chryseolinea sp.]